MSDLDRQATGDGYYEEHEHEDHFCKKCGAELAWADCYSIDCEDGWYDEYEYDAINCEPGTYRQCETCEGKGGWWYCPSCAKK